MKLITRLVQHGGCWWLRFPRAVKTSAVTMMTSKASRISRATLLYTQCSPKIYHEISSAASYYVTSFATIFPNHRWPKNLWLKYGYRKKERRKMSLYLFMAWHRDIMQFFSTRDDHVNIPYLCLTATCKIWSSWWRHQMETFSALLALCAVNSPVTGKFLSQRPVTRSFDVFFDTRIKQTVELTIVRLVILDAIVSIMTSL